MPSSSFTKVFPANTAATRQAMEGAFKWLRQLRATCHKRDIADKMTMTSKGWEVTVTARTKAGMTIVQQLQKEANYE